MTNLAKAIKLNPELPNKIKRCVIMGGCFEKNGNITQNSEYNFFSDVSVAEITFKAFEYSNIKLEICTFEFTCFYSPFYYDL